jgi:L,D-transpeptidase YcbB
MHKIKSLFIAIFGIFIFSLTPESMPIHQETGGRKTMAEGLLRHPSYEQLLEALERYEKMAKNGGWPEIQAFAGVLGKGDSSETVGMLKERLAFTGDFTEEATEAEKDVYDEHLYEAVMIFQRRHGLTIDGIVGSETLAKMNIPVEKKIEDIKFSLESWKQLPSDLGEKYVFVNIPEYKLQAYENRELVLDMRVVVGEVYDGRATPIFNDEITYLEFSPYWNVPQGILRREILPEAEKDISYLDRGNFEIVDRFDPKAQVYANTQENLSRVDDKELYIRQKPGPNNSMGMVKFMFPNEHLVYLHDTPHDQLFHEDQRTFSNGCIRVEKPEELAAFLLKEMGWGLEQVRAEMQNQEQRQVYLEETVPIYIIYWTAFVDEDGLVNFREDVYEEADVS